MPGKINNNSKIVSQTGATLIVDGLQNREVLSFDYAFSQSVDKEFQPSGKARGGQINLTVKAFNDGNAELLTWMINEFSKKSGKIEIMVPGENKKMKDIEFYDAYCTSFKETWEDMSNAKKNQQDDLPTGFPHKEIITISCRKIVNGVTYEGEWK